MLKQSNSILEDIGAELGFSATNALVDWFGGATLYVPECATPDHAIAQIIGYGALRALVDMFGSQTISVPMDIQRDRARTHRLIGALIAKGMSTKQIARVAFMTERMVHYIRLELETAGVMPLIMHPGAASVQFTPHVDEHVAVQ